MRHAWVIVIYHLIPVVLVVDAVVRRNLGLSHPVSRRWASGMSLDVLLSQI